MNMERRCNFALRAGCICPGELAANQVNAAELQEAKVTQVVQDVKVIPSGAAAASGDR